MVRIYLNSQNGQLSYCHCHSHYKARLIIETSMSYGLVWLGSMLNIMFLTTFSFTTEHVPILSQKESLVGASLRTKTRF